MHGVNVPKVEPPLKAFRLSGDSETGKQGRSVLRKVSLFGLVAGK